MIVIGKQLHCTGRDEWRAWLEAHHANAKKVRLIHYKKHTGKPGLALEEAVEEALCFGRSDGEAQSIDDETFVL
jgi:uncharacterized protein YdeI (YjbR/CyaY-like superfamily)